MLETIIYGTIIMKLVLCSIERWGSINYMLRDPYLLLFGFGVRDSSLKPFHSVHYVTPLRLNYSGLVVYTYCLTQFLEYVTDQLYKYHKDRIRQNIVIQRKIICATFVLQYLVIER